jgi:nitrogen fixation protein FixH
MPTKFNMMHCFYAIFAVILILSRLLMNFTLDFTFSFSHVKKSYKKQQKINQKTAKVYQICCKSIKTQRNIKMGVINIYIFIPK